MFESRPRYELPPAAVLRWAAVPLLAGAASAVVAGAFFLATYAMILRRHGKRTRTRPEIQWGWLAAIFGCAAGAVIAGLLTH